MSPHEQSHGHHSGVLNALGVQTSLGTEWVWVLGRAGIAITTLIGGMVYLNGTSAYGPVIALSAFALMYDAGLALVLWRRRLTAVFLVGFSLDNIVLFAGWWIAVKGAAEVSQANDLYLVLFPFLVVGVVRLGWIVGAVYTAVWLGWMSFTYLMLLTPTDYAMRQLPLRLVFAAITSVITLRLVSKLAGERRRVESLLRELQKQTEELADRNIQLEAMDSTRRSLLSTVASGLKTPVAAIKASTARLQASDNQLSTETKDGLVRDINKGVQSLDQLAEDATGYVSLLNTNLSAESRTADVAEICKAALERIRPLVLARHQHVEVDLPHSMPTVSVVPRCCEQVLRNLLANASASSGQGEAIVVKVAIAEGWVITSVADRGASLQEGDREAIFMPFYRYGTPGDGSVPQSGLGLALAKELAEMHRGRLWVENNGDKGKIFFFALPRGDEISNTGNAPGQRSATGAENV